MTKCEIDLPLQKFESNSTLFSKHKLKSIPSNKIEYWLGINKPTFSFIIQKENMLHVYGNKAFETVSQSLCALDAFIT